MMIESSAKEISDEKLAGAIDFAHTNIKPVIDLIEDLASAASKEPFEYQKSELNLVYDQLSSQFKDEIAEAYKNHDKKKRVEFLDICYEKALNEYSEKEGFSLNIFNICFKNLKKNIVRNSIFDSNKRIDGRGLKDVRPIDCKMKLLPRAHGSSLFTRGETQALATVTLGSAQDAQVIDNITGVTSEKFLLHYNFPPYSVGEVGQMKPPGRREIGHGKLANKALQAVLPSSDKYPYTMRVVSEITESNGSSSMATVCASTLSLISAGVPIKNPVSGIAMGLILEKDRYVVLSDILGDEDSLGDMDFKVAATKNGITALQMDIKVTGITLDIMKNAILQAKEGCAHILGIMNMALGTENEDVSPFSPKYGSMKIDPKRIKDVIGAGGKVIKDISETYDVKVDIDNDGNVSVFAKSQNNLDAVLSKIKELVFTPEEGSIYAAKVVKVSPFGIFVRVADKIEGLVHISDIEKSQADALETHFQEGQDVTVKYAGLDKKRRYKFSFNHKAINGKGEKEDKTDKKIYKKRIGSKVVEREKIPSPSLDAKENVQKEAKEGTVDESQQLFDEVLKDF